MVKILAALGALMLATGVNAAVSVSGKLYGKVTYGYIDYDYFYNPDPSPPPRTDLAGLPVILTFSYYGGDVSYSASGSAKAGATTGVTAYGSDLEGAASFTGDPRNASLSIFTDTSFFDGPQVISFSYSGAASGPTARALTGGGNAYAYNDFGPAVYFEFQLTRGSITSTGIPADVPDAPTWMSMIIGFGLIGFASRRKLVARRSLALKTAIASPGTSNGAITPKS